MSSKIVKAYIKHLLNEGERPKSVFSFAESLKMKEADFYNHYASFEALERSILSEVFLKVKNKLEEDETYANYSVREKFLAFFYLWFEQLKEYRSLITILKEEHGMKPATPEFLKGVKHQFEEYTDQLVNLGIEKNEIIKRPYLSDKYSKALWMQHLFLLKFWLEDTSAGFEKTDVAIEKAVNMGFDLMGQSAFDSMLDFGKFLYQTKTT